MRRVLSAGIPVLIVAALVVTGGPVTSAYADDPPERRVTIRSSWSQAFRSIVGNFEASADAREAAAQLNRSYRATKKQAKAARSRVRVLGSRSANSSSSRAVRKAAATAATKALSATDQASLAEAKTKFKLPMTAASKLLKGVGGAASSITSYSMGTMIGGGIVSMFGIDTQGTVCSSTGGVWQTIASVASGVDCSGYGVAEDYPVNGDASAAPVGSKVCASSGTYAGACVQWKGVKTFATGAGSQPYGYATVWEISGTLPTVQVFSLSTCTRFSSPSGSCASFNSSAALWRGVPGSFTTEENWCSFVVPVKNSNGSRCAVTSSSSSTLPPQMQVIAYGLPGMTASQAGHVADGDPNPGRHWQCVITDTAGTAYEAVSASFHESDPQWAPVSCPQLPPEAVTSNVSVWEVNETTGERTKVQDTDTTSGYRTAEENDPECTDGSCVLDLEYKDGTSWKSCFDAGTRCADWWAQRADTDVYRCTYGGDVVDNRECVLYKLVFQSSTSTEYCMPTSTALEDCVSTKTQTDPDTGTSTGTGTAPEYINTEGNDVECFPTGWGVINPVSWVVMPVKCALTWAFLPPATYWPTAVAPLVTAWNATPPVAIPVAAANWSFDFTVTGCDGIGVATIELFGHRVDNPFRVPSACPGTRYADLAAQFRLWSGIVFAVVTGIAIVWKISGTIGVARNAGASS
jgi:hypothetical protein